MSELTAKPVDPNNLPDCEVLAFNGDGEIMHGHLRKASCNDEVWCESLEHSMFYVTKYIEQKDLMELFK
jgi:hypothetical protein